MQQIDIKATQNPGQPYSKKGGLLYFKHRIVIPPQSAIMNQLLQEFHNSHNASYSGVQRTFKRLSQQFYWPSMHKTVSDYVSSCDTC